MVTALQNIILLNLNTLAFNGFKVDIFHPLHPIVHFVLLQGKKMSNLMVVVHVNGKNKEK